MIEYGYAGLFLASFLAATVVPFSSEAIFAAMLVGDFDARILLLMATAGNWLGGMSSYWLGSLGKWEWIEKYLKIKPEKTKKMRQKLRGKTGFIAFFCWLPFVGDVIALTLGLMKENVIIVGLSMLAGKFLRYFFIYAGSEIFF